MKPKIVIKKLEESDSDAESTISISSRQSKRERCTTFNKSPEGKRRCSTVDVQDAIKDVKIEVKNEKIKVKNEKIEVKNVKGQVKNVKDEVKDEWVHAKIEEKKEVKTEEEEDEEEEDTEEEEEDEDGEQMHLFKRCAHLPIGKDHPDTLAEPPALAAVQAPLWTSEDILRVPQSVIDAGKISNPQLECVLNATRRFRHSLPSGDVCGFFLGEGTGCGKGRIISACIIHLWNSGFKRHVWLSANADLFHDAKRDMRDLCAEHIPLIPLKDLPCKDLDSAEVKTALKKKKINFKSEGIVFCTYSLLVSKRSAKKDTGDKENNAWGCEPNDKNVNKPINSRFDQLLKWLMGSSPETGKSGGLIAFDEAHRAKNLAPSSSMKNASSTGIQVDSLQKLAKHCPVMYASATGATDCRNMAYMSRLGLWGPQTAFPTFDVFCSRVEKGGVAAMESIALELKAQGMYSCRSLSYKGVSFDTVYAPLDGSFTRLYNEAAQLWQKLSGVLKRIIADRNVDWSFSSKSLLVRLFWSYVQRFFKQLLVCSKVDETVDLAQREISNGKSVVISMWTTGESLIKEKMEELASSDLDESLSTPQLMIEKIINHHFKVKDKFGNNLDWVHDELEDCLNVVKQIGLPKNPLDELIEKLGGPTKVAEMSGRRERLIFDKDSGKMKMLPRNAHLEGCNINEVNVFEQRSFQNGLKNVAIITEAASCGISLHADRGLPNEPRPRVMIAIELPWSADKAVQQFGRIHRSNQLHSPAFNVMITHMGGERRFVATIARRMKTMGALTKGDRYAVMGGNQKSESSPGGSSMKEKEDIFDFDVYSQYGAQALHFVYQFIMRSDLHVIEDLFSPPCITNGYTLQAFHSDCKRAVDSASLNITDLSTRGNNKDASSVERFLNRLLIVETEIQNDLFAFFIKCHDGYVQRAKEDEMYDSGVENLNRYNGSKIQNIELTRQELLYVDPVTKSETFYTELSLDRGINWITAIEKWNRIQTRISEEEDAGGAPPRRRDDIPSKDVEGFWIYKHVDKTSVMLVSRRYMGSSNSKTTYYVYKPHLGVQMKPVMTYQTLITAKAKRLADMTPGCTEMKEAERLWMEQYEASKEMCSHMYYSNHCAKSSQGGRCQTAVRTFPVHLINGNILRIWGILEDCLSTSRSTKQTDDDVHTVKVENKMTTISKQSDSEKTKLILMRATLKKRRRIVGVRIEQSKLEHIKFTLEVLSNSHEMGNQAEKLLYDVTNTKSVITDGDCTKPLDAVDLTTRQDVKIIVQRICKQLMKNNQMSEAKNNQMREAASLWYTPIDVHRWLCKASPGEITQDIRGSQLLKSIINGLNNTGTINGGTSPTDHYCLSTAAVSRMKENSRVLIPISAETIAEHKRRRNGIYKSEDDGFITHPMEGHNSTFNSIKKKSWDPPNKKKSDKKHVIDMTDEDLTGMPAWYGAMNTNQRKEYVKIHSKPIETVFID
eukprot:GHVL01013425.1.p1 GENE.GHVL01013425.1~~GHVL01013425.1.p1  ORF type:complete len:1459 (-),score=314.98 GHVL01013425.1:852-5228(-)